MKILTEKQYEEYEESQHKDTEEAIGIALAFLRTSRKNIDKELADFYRKYGQDGVVTYEEAKKWAGRDDRRRRMVVLFLVLSKTINILFKNLRETMDSHLRNVIHNEFKLHEVELSDDLLEKILKTKWENEYGEANWLDRLNAYEGRWDVVLKKDVKTAFHTHNDLDDVMDDYDIRFKSMKNILITLFVTETTAVDTIARRDILKKNGISKYKFYARMDERTCEHCGALHGLVFPVSAYEPGVNASPLHPRCRCIEVPIKG